MGALEGKVAVITGGNSGIGLATARRFVKEGAYVFITGRRQEELDKAVSLVGKNVTGVQGDVSNFRTEENIMLKLNNLALCAVALLPIVLTAQTLVTSAAQAQTANDHRADEAAIEQVMKQYHAAILAHDGTTLSGLFLPDANLWLNVLTDSAYAKAQAKSAAAQKVRVSSYRDFAKLVSTTPKSFDPEHSNVVIHTDGTIAAVYFEFVFNVDGKASNRGSETWQLVKAADGWRIASIIYSSEPPA